MSFGRFFRGITSFPSPVTIHPSWFQGRTAYGGLSTALLHESLASQVSLAPLRSLQVTFVGPVLGESPLCLESKLLRTGKSVALVRGEGLQDGDTKIAALGAFGMKRDSVIRVVPERVQFLNQAAFDAHPVSAFDEKKWPGFCRNFEYKYLTSEAFSGTKETVMRGYVRHATESEEASPASRLLALIDAWPSPVLPMLDQPCNASSLTMSVDIVHEDVGVADGEWVQYESRVRHSESGYATVGERVWSMEGELLAISQQNVVHFA